jgi:hypothetical protein
VWANTAVSQMTRIFWYDFVSWVSGPQILPQGCWTAKKKELWSFETSRATNPTTRRHKPEHLRVNPLRHVALENIIFYQFGIAVSEVFMLSLFTCYFSSLDVPTANVVKQTDGNTQNTELAVCREQI